MDDRDFISCRDQKFCRLHDHTPALGPIQPSIQWAPRVLSRRVKVSERGMTIHLPLVPRVCNAHTLISMSPTDCYGFLTIGTTLPLTRKHTHEFPKQTQGQFYILPFTY